jgi:short-subunit dehydrogenase
MSSLKRFAPERIWVVTGAASGIGRDMVRQLLELGAVVWALDFNESSLRDLEAEASRNGGSLHTAIVDVTDFDAVRRCIELIKLKSRRIDVWINNAGIQKVGSLTELESSSFDLVMRVNFSSVVNITRELIKLMEGQGEGIILNMASVAGHVPAPFMSAYVASKHAIVGFSRAIRAELQLLKSPVQCLIASPGFVDTAIIEKGAHSGFPEWLSWLLANPKTCAREILNGVAAGEAEIEPTLNGRAMTAAFKLLPRLTVKSSRILLTRGIGDIVLNRYQVPRV